MKELVLAAGVKSSKAKDVANAMTELILAADGYANFMTNHPVVVATQPKRKHPEDGVKVFKQIRYHQSFKGVLKAFSELPDGIEGLARAIDKIPLSLSKVFDSGLPLVEFWELGHVNPPHRSFDRYALGLYDALTQVYEHHAVEIDWERDERTGGTGQPCDWLYDPGAFQAMKTIAAFYIATQKSKRSQSAGKSRS